MIAPEGKVSHPAQHAQKRDHEGAGEEATGLGDMASTEQQFLSVAEISRHLQLSRGQVKDLVLAGRFGEYVRNAGGHLRVRTQHVVNLNGTPPKIIQKKALERKGRSPSVSELFWLYDQDP